MIKQIRNSIKNLRRSPLLMFVTIPGLAIGLSASLLLFSYIIHETGYDKHFPNKDKVVRLYNTISVNGEVNNFPITLRNAYTEYPEKIPEIKLATQLYRGWSNNIYYKESELTNQQLLYVDAEFFDVFGLDLIDGDKKTALKQKNTTVLNETLAKKLFNNEKCIGKLILINEVEYTVTGVIKDLPNRTHFNFDLLISMNSMHTMDSLEYFTYYLLKENTDFKIANAKIAALNDNTLLERFKVYIDYSKSGVERLPDLHFYSITDFDLSPKANINNIYMIGFLAVFILLIAVVNHLNLFIQHGEKRFLEIGIRKSLGASLFDLKKMFYIETGILNIVAFIIAFFIAAAALPYFAALLNVNILLEEIFTVKSIGLILGFLVFLIFITAAYPAAYLSKLKLINAVKGGSKTLRRRNLLSVSSVIIQFSISVFLIISLLIINHQVSFLKNYPLGFNTENVIGVDGFDLIAGEKSETIKKELNNLVFVRNTGASFHHMGGGCSGQLLYKQGESEKEGKPINEYRIQNGFCKTMNLKLVSGRFFTGSPEDVNSVVLNQASVKSLDLKDPIGQTVIMFSKALKIIGVVKDFYYNENSGKRIEPLMLTAYSDRTSVFYVKTASKLTQDQKQQITAIFKKFKIESSPNYFELSENYESKFYEENRIVKIVLYGTILAIFLSFTGMFALSVFNVENRTKEIGVRKVLGSSSREIVVRLLKDTLKWVLWSMPFAFLIAFIFMKKWLQNYAIKTEINILFFVLGGGIALLIATLAISIKTIQAARRNPVESIKYE